MPGLVPGIQPTARSGVRFALDPGNPGQFAGAGKCRDDTEPSVGAGAPAPRGGEGGFTLIEMLVALVLLVMVVALVAAGLRYARGTWEATARLDALAGADMAETFLRARLSEAMPVYAQRKAGTVRVLFHGTGDALSFVAPAPNGPAGAGLYRYALEVAEGAGPGRHALVVKLAPYYGGRDTPDDVWTPRQHVLVRNLRSVTFRYFGRGEIKAQPAWHAAWTRTDAMPSLVEIAIARDDSEGGPIALVVELRLAGQR